MELGSLSHEILSQAVCGSGLLELSFSVDLVDVLQRAGNNVIELFKLRLYVLQNFLRPVLR
jgi:hypothetical protein